MTKVQCPNCKKEVVWSTDSPFRPFCCERCALIDLGAWADESYSIPTQEHPEDNDPTHDSEEDSSEH